MTPIELVAIVFVVGSFVAIGARFTPRDAFGVRRAPRPIDDSLGMYALRRLRRRSTLTEGDLVQPTLEEILQRIGVEPAQATADADDGHAARRGAGAEATLVASTAPPPTAEETRRPQPVGPVPPGDLLAAMRAAVERPPRTITQRMPQAALTTQRRVGGLVAVALVVAAGFGGISLVGSPGGGVLEAVGTPAPAPAAPAASPAGSELPPDSVGPSAGPAGSGD